MAFKEPEEAVDRKYVDAGGTVRRVPPDVVAMFEEMLDPGDGAGPVVTHPGDPFSGRATVLLEGGGEIALDGVVPPDMPVGYHTFDTGGGGRRLIVSPGRCALPSGWRAWGWAAQLYAARSRRSWGVGDLSDLGELARQSARRGAGFVLINPLRAAAPIEPQEPSPYSPTSRRFLNPLYLDVDAVPAPLGSGGAVEDLAAAARVLNSDRRIDRDAVMRVKMAALERLFAAGGADDTFDAWFRSDDDVQAFAAWSVLVERFGADWRSWPMAYRRASAVGTRQVIAASDQRVRFHGWLQWLLREQLTRATTATRLVQDLPIGFDPAGMDAWQWQDLLAPGVSVGAPPDELNPAGQDWSLPAFVPGRLAAADYQPFIDTIRSSLTMDGGLRIDHVMGLFRLWWIPAGAGPDGGAYVRYPVNDLLDIVALESVRHRAVVVGEDLGTVEPGVREELAARNLMSYRLLWFEDESPSAWPEQSMAAITTHDLPTVRGLWDGSDVATLRSLGVAANEDGLGEMRQRLVDVAGLADGTDDGAAVVAAHRAIGGAPSRMLCVTLDDLMVVAERPNVPGAPATHPNWSIALPHPIDTLVDSDVVDTVSRALDDAIRSDGPPARVPVNEADQSCGTPTLAPGVR